MEPSCCICWASRTPSHRRQFRRLRADIDGAAGDTRGNFEAAVDYFGRRYVYAGVAPRRRNGKYDGDALRWGEWIVEPGLVYRSAGGAAAPAG
jgi:hypothetical protein